MTDTKTAQRLCWAHFDARKCCSDHRTSNHYSSMRTLCRVAGGWSLLLLTLGKGWGTGWTVPQFITGLTYKDEQPHTQSSSRWIVQGNRSTRRKPTQNTGRTWKLHTERPYSAPWLPNAKSQFFSHLKWKKQWNTFHQSGRKSLKNEHNHLDLDGTQHHV